METEQKKTTAEAIQKAEKNFAMDLPMLVKETARDEKILKAISALEVSQMESILSSTLTIPTEATYLPDSACFLKR